MRARFYDPTIGRFLSEDPIWSTNLYPYADNNPVMRIDPKGTIGAPIGAPIAEGIRTLTTSDAAIELPKMAVEMWVRGELQQLASLIPAAPAAIKGAEIAVKESAKGIIKMNSGIPLHGSTLIGGYLLEGAAVGSFLVGYSIGNGINAASNSKNLSQFVNNMDKSGDPVYKASQWVGNKIEQGLDATLGKIIKK
jgi:hypothetical protein